jgi:hypothetical protein
MRRQLGAGGEKNRFRPDFSKRASEFLSIFARGRHQGGYGQIIET